MLKGDYPEQRGTPSEALVNGKYRYVFWLPWLRAPVGIGAYGGLMGG
jgi:hypothetical protein